MPTHVMQRLSAWARFLAVLLGGVTAATAYSDAGFEPYRLILDRQPFGPDGASQPPVAAPTPPAESFARHLRLCAIVETAAGEVQVGLIDSQTKKHFLLAIGETEEGIELVAADPGKEEALLRRGSELVTVRLKSGDVLPSAEPPPRAVVPTDSRRQSYLERRQQREEERRQREAAVLAVPAQPRLTGQELERHLQAYQMDVIRQGLPPLPIPLTEEMDDQLVNEGVLPPVQ